MLDEEVYIEETNIHRNRITIILIIVFVSLFFFCFVFLKNRYTLTLEPIHVEVGERLTDEIDFFVENEVIDEDDYVLYLKDIPVNKEGILDTVGEFKYRVKYKNIVKTNKIIVEDTTPPSVETQTLTIGVNENYEVDWFILECDDYSKPCNVTYKNPNDENLHKKAGNYDFSIVIEDNAGNKITKKVLLNVKKGYSIVKDMKKNMEISSVYPEVNDWNNEFFVKFNEGVDEETVGLADEYQYLYEYSNADLMFYLSSEYIYNTIIDHELILIYNKYDYVIGFAIRAKLDNGKYIYLTK